MHLRDEGTHGVDDDVGAAACSLNDVGRRAVRAQYDRAAGGNVVDVVHEDDAEPLEACHDVFVVHDRVHAVHGRVVQHDRPRERLDGCLDTGAVAAWRHEHDTTDVHNPGNLVLKLSAGKTRHRYGCRPRGI